MARKLRVEYRGAIYHVMNRGDRREFLAHPVDIPCPVMQLFCRQFRADVSPASSSSSPAPSSAPLVEQSDRPKSENRSDSGQKRTDSVPAPGDFGFVVPKPLENRSDFGQERTDSIPSTPTGPQPSVLNFQHPPQRRRQVAGDEPALCKVYQGGVTLAPHSPVVFYRAATSTLACWKWMKRPMRTGTMTSNWDFSPLALAYSALATGT